MIASGLGRFRGRKILMLQGPIGPFFYRLSKDLKRAGAEVTKINFNAGDTLFYPSDFISFNAPSSEWGEFVEKVIRDNKIDLILLFGDCRRMHRSACKVAKEIGVEVGVFEEGYMRPDYLTLDEGGVNGHSSIPKNASFYKSRPRIKIQNPVPVGQTIWQSATFAVMYYTATILLNRLFPHYTHHRPLDFYEGYIFIKSFFRKQLYKITEIGIHKELVSKFSKKFYLVPLQVYNDSQIKVHSSYSSNTNFIEEVISSFAKNADEETVLVIKHHPMDRGYSNYRLLIEDLAKKYNVEMNRLYYIHDQHLPTLLQHTRGVVLVNSTVGLQALHHNAPLKVCGNSIYDFEGMTYQGDLDSFWNEAQNFNMDRDLYERYKEYVIIQTQINGSIYKPLNIQGTYAGLVWQDNFEVMPVEEAIPLTAEVKVS